MSLAFVIAAIAFALWAAAVQADYMTFGTYGVVLALSLACGWASLLPWRK